MSSISLKLRALFAVCAVFMATCTGTADSPVGTGRPSAVEFDPTIADVHTQPTDEKGNDVGRVLHVGTGYARAMVVTVNTCTGPRAYAGLASSYAEKITEGWQRLNDEDWANGIESSPFPDVSWMQRALSE